MERHSMKILRSAVAIALVASFSVLASSPAQSQSYSNVTVTVSQRTVVGGNSILIEATVDPPSTECEWELSFMGQTETGSGSSISETFSTPEVDEEEVHYAVAICTYDDGTGSALGSVGGGTGTLGMSLAQAEVEAFGIGRQVLLPEDDDGDDDDDGDGDGDGDDDGDGDGDGDGGGDGGDNGGLLPNTGGERLAWLIIGAMLVMVGGGVVVASRRRDA
jgi:LPXTG-motif cell wall-anchored protein